MKLYTLKQDNNQRLTKEIGDRELDKLADFKKSSLNIKLVYRVWYLIRKGGSTDRINEARPTRPHPSSA